MRQYFDDITFRGLTTEEIFTTDIPLVSPMKGENKWGNNTKPDNSIEGLMQVYDAAKRCRYDEWPESFNGEIGIPEKFDDLPAVLQNMIFKEQEMNNRSSVADAASWLVSMDHPMALGFALLDEFWPKRDNHVLFVERRTVEAVLAHAVALALEEVFKVKWFWMTARPVEKLRYLSKYLDEGFECYPHPAHPANGAGHGAASEAASIVVSRLLGLEGQAAEDCRVTCKAFRNFRSYSGMHTVDENECGAFVAAKTTNALLESFGE